MYIFPTGNKRKRLHITKKNSVFIFPITNGKHSVFTTYYMYFFPTVNKRKKLYHQMKEAQKLKKHEEQVLLRKQIEVDDVDVFNPLEKSMGPEAEGGNSKQKLKNKYKK